MIWRGAYAAALWLALPVVLFRLWWRGRKEPSYRVDWPERLGFYGTGQRDASKPLIWIHAVSLGETRAAQPLLSLLEKSLPGYEFLVTHMTATGRDAARELYAGRASFSWLPLDYPFAVRRFLDRFRPRLAILMETEVWFNLVRCSSAAGVPLLLANARLSAKSARGYDAVSPLAREAFAALTAVAAQTEADAARLRALGARDVRVTGNLKFDVRADRQMEELAGEFRRRYAGRRVFLAASTRDGEEELILDALEGSSLPSDVLVVMVPRHPQRFEEVGQLFSARGLSWVARSNMTSLAPDCRFLLGDSLGEMPAYYAAADVAFIGGSLLAFGGQNLIEACAAGVPVLFGPYTYNFSDASRAALEEGAARVVANADALIQSVSDLLADDASRIAMGQSGKAFCGRHRGAAQRVGAMVEELLGSER